jgi:hypothetical protein
MAEHFAVHHFETQKHANLDTSKRAAGVLLAH